jgi:hypothetical protein
MSTNTTVNTVSDSRTNLFVGLSLTAIAAGSYLCYKLWNSYKYTTLECSQDTDAQLELNESKSGDRKENFVPTAEETQTCTTSESFRVFNAMNVRDTDVKDSNDLVQNNCLSESDLDESDLDAEDLNESDSEAEPNIDELELNTIVAMARIKSQTES